MKSTLSALLCALACSSALAAKPCEELKSEIAAKLDAAGVKNYSLDVVDTDKVGDAKVVGSCDGGTKKVTYAKK
jgi:hypothetical protein